MHSKFLQAKIFWKSKNLVIWIIDAEMQLKNYLFFLINKILLKNNNNNQKKKKNANAK